MVQSSSHPAPVHTQVPIVSILFQSGLFFITGEAAWTYPCYQSPGRTWSSPFVSCPPCRSGQMYTHKYQVLGYHAERFHCSKHDVTHLFILSPYWLLPSSGSLLSLSFSRAFIVEILLGVAFQTGLSHNNMEFHPCFCGLKFKFI